MHSKDVKTSKCLFLKTLLRKPPSLISVRQIIQIITFTQDYIKCAGIKSVYWIEKNTQATCFRSLAHSCIFSSLITQALLKEYFLTEKQKFYTIIFNLTKNGSQSWNSLYALKINSSALLKKKPPKKPKNPNLWQLRTAKNSTGTYSHVTRTRAVNSLSAGRDL